MTHPVFALPQSDAEFAQLRKQMVDVAVVGAGVTDQRVIKSMLDND